MAVPRFYGLIMGLRARKRLGSHWGLRAPYFHPETGHYRHPQGGGKVYQVRQGVQITYSYSVQQNNRWVNQQRWREIHSLGITAAQALSDEEKAVYAEIAKGKRMGWWMNAFMSEWLHAHGPLLYEWKYEFWEERKWG